MRRASFLILLWPGFLTAADRHIVLVTSDGLRWQEVFRGIDSLIARESKDAQARVARFPTREALLPFFWNTVAKNGIVFNDVSVTNAYRVSYPGYSEILTGRASDDVIKGNDPVQQPNETVLEFFKRKLKLTKSQIAVFSSWDHFTYIAEHTPGAISINSRSEETALTPWDEARHDSFTFGYALDYLKSIKPRVLYISFDETDDWAHAKRYDRVLDMIAIFDSFLKRLWMTIQSMPEYRDSTTLIITSDHGRGSTLTDWSGHGSKIAGAEKIWLAAIGPDTPAAGVVGTHVEQRDIAPTMIKLMGLNPAEYVGATGIPIKAVLK